MQARLEMAEMVGMEGIDMVKWEVDPMGEALDGLIGEATDLFMHFSMWPFRTSRLLNFLPQCIWNISGLRIEAF